MKFRFVIIVALAILTVFLSACNFTLAEDMTPPPNYVPPTPAPTLGPLYPAQAPNIENGALIYAEKCAPCHGETGLGDGEQGIQLGVTVPAFGLAEIARPASPAEWYTIVTRGNMERFMPPFASLTDQERWDVVAYAMTLHISEDEIERGEELFEASCADCTADFFRDQSKMASLSEVELARIVKQGNEEVTAFGSDLSDDEVWAVAAYLRTLPFDAASVVSAPGSTVTPETATVPETAVSSDERTAVASDATDLSPARVGTVSGSVENKTGTDLPSGLTVTLRGYDHGADPSTGPQEVFSQETSVNEDGSFVFENIEMPLNRIFIAELSFDGMDLQSDFGIVKEGDDGISLPPITLYDKSEDTSKLVMDEARIFIEYGSDTVQVFNVYSFRNPSEEIILVKLNEDSEVPFLKPPEGSSGVGYEPIQDSEPLIQVENGFGIPPSEGSYGLLAFSSLPRAKELDFSQTFLLPANTLTVFLPEGVTLENPQLNDLGVQKIQNFNFHVYELNEVDAGETVTFTVLGAPQEAATSAAEISSNRNLLIGAGALGVALILGGAWLYLRDRNQFEEEELVEVENDEFESAEDVMDAIIALDDLHRAKKISDEAYHKRRAELKDVLKGMI